MLNTIKLALLSARSRIVYLHTSIRMQAAARLLTCYCDYQQAREPCARARGEHHPRIAALRYMRDCARYDLSVLLSPLSSLLRRATAALRAAGLTLRHATQAAVSALPLALLIAYALACGLTFAAGVYITDTATDSEGASCGLALSLLATIAGACALVFAGAFTDPPHERHDGHKR